MPVPTVTFPVEQHDIRNTREQLEKYLKGIRAEEQIILTMLKTICSFCAHSKKKGYLCLDCGLDSSPDW